MSENTKQPGREVEPLWSSYIHDKGNRLGLPVSGSFELTPRCNFDCKMCYVHQTPEQIAASGRKELTADQWRMAEGNLYYAYLPDGAMMDGDYPYLTYNDLLDLQSLYTARHGSLSVALQTLMDSKRVWMDANGVTDYNLAPAI